MAQRPDCSTSYDSLVGSCNTLLSITIYKYLLLNPRKSFVSTGRSPIVLYYNNQDHVRAPLTPPMTIVRIKYSSVYREINISPHKNINSLISKWKLKHNRTQTVCDLACRKGLDVLDLPPAYQTHQLAQNLSNFGEGRFRLHSMRDEEAKLDLEENKIVEFIKLDFGNVVMVTGGRNRGRVGVIRNPAKLKGSFETTTTYKTQQDMSLQQG
ncbi:hypothetical protein IGI04_008182 [Brassica rapa subsp. trilocularis]|uniref:KOW domain-containing protein n=1 Tax=Brassica rapa subsp. trilocularis TaxID=1813537 RepID=A0ABQ7NLV7_BRACM|nr:hypothetical protein IGI04_008182 [Brassica rapa subsp. trilocularis]